jgi:hypothetical protein
LDIVRAVEFSALSCVDIICLAASSHFAFAANRGDTARVPVFVDVNAESASLLDRERQIGRIHFVHIALAQFANTEVNGTFSQAHLDDASVKIEEGKCGHAAKVDARLTSLQFGARILVAPDFVADGHGAVPRSAPPITGASWLHRNRAINRADARYARRRIAFIGSRVLYSKKEKTA